jgi:hypothetical protein
MGSLVRLLARGARSGSASVFAPVAQALRARLGFGTERVELAERGGFVFVERERNEERRLQDRAQRVGRPAVRARNGFVRRFEVGGEGLRALLGHGRRSYYGAFASCDSIASAISARTCFAPKRCMPDDDTRARKRARTAKRQGKAPTTQAGEFVREEIHHIREGKHGARSPKQAIAIALSKARRAGVNLPPPRTGRTSAATRKRAERDYARGHGAPPRRPTSMRRRRAMEGVLEREGRGSASHEALSRQARSAAARRGPVDRKRAAQKAVRTKGPAKRQAAARKAARTRHATRGR